MASKWPILVEVSHTPAAEPSMGWGVQNLGKPAYTILERSLMPIESNLVNIVTDIITTLNVLAKLSPSSS